MIFKTAAGEDDEEDGKEDERVARIAHYRRDKRKRVSIRYFAYDSYACCI